MAEPNNPANASLNSKLPYKQRLQLVVDFKLQNPLETAKTAAMIYNVKPDSVRVALRRMPRAKKNRGGQNVILLAE
jgi:hypothetical protein